ncbi:MAG TPA: hypothetical protein VMV05_01785 [bacterium]|nr:hypothetical protein [bacterium]
MKTINRKGGGLVGTLIMVLLLAGLAWGAYYFFFNGNGANPSQTASTASGDPTPTPSSEPKAGSLAGAAVQGAQAAGEVLGSGR